MIRRVIESTNHYEPIKDFRIKNVKDGSKKRFWIAQYYLYKNAIKENKPLRSILPQNPHVIKFIPKPTFDEQMAAILANPSVLAYIKNADPYVQLRAVKVEPYLIKYVRNPTDEMWIWAMENDPRMILKNPKPNWFMVRYAQEKNVRGLNSHKGLTDEMRAYLTLVA